MKVLCILVLCVLWLGTLDVYRPSRFRCEFLYIGRITSLVVLSGVVSVRLSYVATATCALASFWLSQSGPSDNAQGGVLWQWRDSNPRSSHCYIPVAPADSGRTLQSALSVYRLSLPCDVGVGGIEPPLRPNLTMLVAPVYQSFTPYQCL